MESKPNYYSILPATVRYDKRLTPNARLLYSEITALCNKEGYCGATNKYFEDLFEVGTSSITKWIRQLKDYGYITTELIYKEGSKEIDHRYIRIVADPMVEKYHTSMVEKYQENNINNNTTSNNIDSKSKSSKSNPPTLEEVYAYISEKALNVDGKQFFDYFSAGNWFDSKGNKVKNWKQKLLTWHKFNSASAKPTKPSVQDSVQYKKAMSPTTDIYY